MTTIYLLYQHIVACYHPRQTETLPDILYGMEASSKYLIWIDLEFTSLDYDSNHILEIAAHITDNDLKILDEGISIVLSQPERILETMDDWSTKHHEESGLLSEVRSSHVSISEAESRIIAHITSIVPKSEEAPLCGSSITYDRLMIIKHMPGLAMKLHYKNIDVSSIKELAHRWAPEMEEFKKGKKHRALPDICESIAELRYYKERLFRV